MQFVVFNGSPIYVWLTGIFWLSFRLITAPLWLMVDQRAGWGTNEDLIISILAHRNAAQRCLIRKTYAEIYGEDLLKELDNELSSDFEARLLFRISPLKIRNRLDWKSVFVIKYLYRARYFSRIYSPLSVSMNFVVLHTADCTFVDIATCRTWCIYGQWSNKEVNLKQFGHCGNSLYSTIARTIQGEAGLSCPFQEISWRRCCISYIWRYPQGIRVNFSRTWLLDYFETFKQFQQTWENSMALDKLREWAKKMLEGNEISKS